MKERYVLNGEKQGTGRSQLIKTSALALVVVSVHVVAIGGFFAIQGCGTVQREPRAVEPAPAPVMPPKASVAQQQRAPRRAIRPPVPVEPAPPMRDQHRTDTTYIIQKGDSLSRIAQRFDVSTKELCELNGIKNPNLVRVGQKLMLPPYAKKQSVTAPKKPAARPQSRAVVSSGAPSATASGDQYVVQPGDVLSKIAVKYGTTVQALRETNKLSGDKIIVGQKLTIPKGSAAPATKPAAPALAAKI
ncbi:MAG: LysM peptidoglycan-binding domain-containing protein, partial [Kiritimatiellae bacterium]|nr:LysM peptidoglycan-binding domain-containing protein [Kiritimatiellia bacterium]